MDDGFSGTNTDHRPAFKLMMKDAMEGKVDMIITKSVSRFARNLLDCIGWVRELKDKHDPPIAVFFEQEHLDTLDTTSNIILFVLAMVAEEESHMCWVSLRRPTAGICATSASSLTAAPTSIP